MKSLLAQSLGVTAILLVLFKFIQIFLPPSWVALLIPTLLIYLPFALLTFKKEPLDFVDRSWVQLGRGLAVFLLTVLVVFPPYSLLAYLWMIKVFHYQQFQPAPWSLFFQNIDYQLLMVALPEEFYFRGFLQPILNKLWRPKWRILGVWLGWGWIVTALIFAFAHSVITLRWWHFSIFFPALLFGYLKERTGSITAPVLFHAFSNCFMNWFAQSYF